jgi:hypothetical protein
MSFNLPDPPQPAPPAMPAAPAPPPTFGAQSQPQGSKPQPKGQPTFLGAGLTATPAQSGGKTLLGQ